MGLAWILGGEDFEGRAGLNEARGVECVESGVGPPKSRCFAGILAEGGDFGWGLGLDFGG